jgi:phage tail-like protein
MAVQRPASLIATCDQWVRATHHGTAVDGVDGELTLSWTDRAAPDAEPGGCRSRGLATDRFCRIYRLHEDRLTRLAVGPTAAGLDYADLPEPVTLIGGVTPPPPPGPDFGTTGTGATIDPVGLAIDGDDRLFLADRATRTVSIIDLWSRRLLRAVTISTPNHPDRTPFGLAHRDGVVYLVARNPNTLLRLTATRGPDVLPWPDAVDDLPPDAEPSRVAVLDDGTPVVLLTATDGTGWLIAGRRAPRAVGPASDIVVDGDGAVVIAPCGHAGPVALRRVAPTADGWTPANPLDASNYDGGGLVLTRDGRIGYFTPSGFRLAVIGLVDYETDGTCTTYRLDSGQPRNQWGRVLIEACIPDGTRCLIATVSTDDEYVSAVAHLPALPAACTPATPVSPPLPPPALAVADGQVAAPLHRRGDPVTPWWRGDDRFATFEAPVTAPPGRYLWVTLRLIGNRRRTPRVREVRVEQQSHGLLRRLPAVFTEDPAQATFLHGYLATLDGILHDLDVRASCRDILIDPHGTPAEALDWLASFFGLVLDGRWAEAARRQLVAEIVALYRLRGTVWALGRYIEIFLAGDRAGEPGLIGVAPVIIEHFRLRGVGGALLGGEPSLSSRSVLGAGFRVGGAVGELGSTPLDPDDTATSAFASHAHRFTVLIPRPLVGEEEAAIRYVLNTERPAHTVYDLCTVDAGMRVGDGLHVGISSIIGPTGAFEHTIAGRTLLGRRSILGPPSSGIAVEAARVGTSARVG